MIPIVLLLALIAILSALSMIDTHLTFAAGLAWLWFGLTAYPEYPIAYMLIALIVGLYFIFKGVWIYVPEK